MKLSLIENSHSFLSESLEKALKAEGSPHQWKFAILSLVQAIELALKERLRIEHPYLIYSDIDKPNNTVSIEKAANRLQTIVGVTLNDSDIKNIRTASKVRNFIVHHGFELNEKQIKAVFGKLLGFISEFYKNHLNVKIIDIVPVKYWNEAVEIDEYVKELYARAQKQIAKEKIQDKFVMSCPRCWQDTFVWFTGKDQCYLCGHEEEVTVCQECGLLLFRHEAHHVYYGKWMSGDKKEFKEWYPDLCDSCFENYVFDEETQTVEFID